MSHTIRTEQVVTWTCDRCKVEAEVIGHDDPTAWRRLRFYWLDGDIAAPILDTELCASCADLVAGAMEPL